MENRRKKVQIFFASRGRGHPGPLPSNTSPIGWVRQDGGQARKRACRLLLRPWRSRAYGCTPPPNYQEYGAVVPVSLLLISMGRNSGSTDAAQMRHRCGTDAAQMRRKALCSCSSENHVLYVCLEEEEEGWWWCRRVVSPLTGFIDCL